MLLPLTDNCIAAISRAREIGGESPTGDYLMVALLEKHSLITYLLDRGNVDVYKLRIHLEQLCATDTGLLDGIVARATETAAAMGRSYVSEDFLFYAVLEQRELRTTAYLSESCPDLAEFALTALMFLGYPRQETLADIRKMLESLERTQIDWTVPTNEHRKYLKAVVGTLAAERAVVWRADPAQCICQYPDGNAANTSHLQTFLHRGEGKAVQKLEDASGRKLAVFLNTFGVKSEFVLEVERQDTTKEAINGFGFAIAKLCDSLTAQSPSSKTRANGS